MQEADPAKPWSTELMKAKRRIEKNRYRQYKALIEDYASYEEENEGAFPTLSEEQWASFLERHPTAKWLRTTPLGDRDIYEQAFPSQERLGSFIVAAGEEDTLLETVWDDYNANPTEKNRKRALDRETILA
ncbi:uncharacterized protein F4812DRAFT_419646 [Daldinia caldariorum]|uniref:uncharacterized protein n=1 Tax=Daldinia caldariorum TaxID=326644 RepID=UPI0020082F7A|nr:uncharacterized protein F4812DRAFT_419646 [Daldinia caldariorum]KAI1470963.1 hypothetical protein F4812DRAFT_419646 [Daldinia caldariorum]